VIQVEYTVKTILPGGVISGKSGDFGIVTGEFFPDKVQLASGNINTSPDASEYCCAPLCIWICWP
jgi:hypothetical protein